MNRADFQKLADTRLKEAEALLAASLWDSAYYLAGYAVECELKAAIVGRVGREPWLIFAEQFFQKNCWTHSLKALVELAGLQVAMDSRLRADSDFADCWLSVSKWSEKARYESKAEADARALLDAISHPANGVLPWLVSLR